MIVAFLAVGKMARMSESPQPGPEQPPRAGPARYQRSSGGLIGALIVTVLAVLAFSLFRSLTRDNPTTPVRAVDYRAVVTAARAQAELPLLAPERLPLGWKATSATYDSAKQRWHLGMLTDKDDYVGVEESRDTTEAMVRTYVDKAATRGKNVTIGGQKWQSWTDAGGDYAVVRLVDPTAIGKGVVLVVGTAPEDEIRDLAGSLVAESP